VLHGPSNIGKTAFSNNFFQIVFNGKFMSLDKNRPFSDKGVYDKDCNVWIFPDINADIGYKALLRL
jgi:septin family protein